MRVLPGSFPILAGALVVGAVLVWLLSPVEERAGGVGVGGKVWTLSDGVRVVQPLVLPEGFRGTLVLFARRLPESGAVRVTFRDGVDGVPLAPAVRPRVRAGHEVYALRVRFPRRAEGRSSLAVEVTTEGVSAADPFTLRADARGEADAGSLHVFGMRSAGRPVQEARRPAVLSHDLLLRRPRLAAVTPGAWGAVGRGAAVSVAGALLYLGGVPAAARWHRLSARQRRQRLWIGAALLLLAGGGARWWYARALPLVNDEQAYVYDAMELNPRRPYFWKSPVLVTLEGGFLRMTGLDDPVTPRVPIVAAGLATAAILGLIGRELAGARVGGATFALALLLPDGAAYSTLVMAEQLLALPALAGILVALRARRRARPSAAALTLSSVLVALSVLVRWSGAFWYLPLLLLLATKPPREFLRRAAIVLVVPFLGLLGGLLFLKWVVALRLPDFLLAFVSGSVANLPERLATWRLAFARLLPVWALIGLAGGAGARSWGRTIVVWVLLLGLFIWPHFSGAAGELSAALPAAALAAALFVLWAASRALPPVPSGHRPTVTALAFLLPPLLAYAVIGRANEKYLAEFLPGLLLLSGLGFSRLLEAALAGRRTLAPLLGSAALMLIVVAGYPAYRSHPYAGTTELEAARQAVTALRDVTHEGQPVLAAGALIPLLAGRPLAGGIPHPAWEQHVLEERPRSGHPPYAAAVASLLAEGRAAAVVTDKLFVDTFGRHASVREALQARYRPVREIRNGMAQPLVIHQPRGE